MLTILSALIGFLSAALPEYLNLQKEKHTQSHQEKLLELELKAKQKNFTLQHTALQAQHHTESQKHLYSTYFTRIKWIDALNGTVRPVLAYAFFCLYATLKLLTYHQTQSLPSLWTPEDQAIFASIIAFYFGQRAIRKSRGVVE